jgi:HTH-type transcriptional regulator/antitoxin HigA
MEPLLYKVIKTEKQYYEYCDMLEELVMLKKKTRPQQDVVELLTLLIEKWDQDHNSFPDTDPIALLKYLMSENNIRGIDLAGVLEVSKSLVSDILNYRRGLSKDMIRKIAGHFKLSQEAFNKPYELVAPVNTNA